MNKLITNYVLNRHLNVPLLRVPFVLFECKMENHRKLSTNGSSINNLWSRESSAFEHLKHCPNTTQYRFAGHSKWQNIRHTKMSKDQERAKKIAHFAKLVRRVVHEPGGADPKLNKNLADILASCQRQNIPKATIDRNIQKGLERKPQDVRVEIIGPEGCIIIIDAESYDQHAVVKDIRKLLKKLPNFMFAPNGRTQHMFQTRGVIRINKVDRDGNAIVIDKAEEIAIEAEAEEVLESHDGNAIEFLTEPIYCEKVAKFITENTNYDVIEYDVESIPVMRIQISEESMQMVSDFIEQLETVEGVNKTFDNIL